MTTKKVIKSGFITSELKFTSTGLIGICKECQSIFGYANKPRQFYAMVENSDLTDEGTFSHTPCDDCNRGLGDNSYIAHGIDETGELVHFRVCYNCFYEINGYTICKECDHACADYGSYCYNCNTENGE